MLAKWFNYKDNLGRLYYQPVLIAENESENPTSFESVTDHYFNDFSEVAGIISKIFGHDIKVNTDFYLPGGTLYYSSENAPTQATTEYLGLLGYTLTKVEAPSTAEIDGGSGPINAAFTRTNFNDAVSFGKYLYGLLVAGSINVTMDSNYGSISIAVPVLEYGHYTNKGNSYDVDSHSIGLFAIAKRSDADGYFVQALNSFTGNTGKYNLTLHDYNNVNLHRWAVTGMNIYWRENPESPLWQTHVRMLFTDDYDNLVDVQSSEPQDDLLADFTQRMAEFLKPLGPDVHAERIFDSFVKPEKYFPSTDGSNFLKAEWGWATQDGLDTLKKLIPDQYLFYYQPILGPNKSGSMYRPNLANYPDVANTVLDKIFMLYATDEFSYTIVFSDAGASFVAKGTSGGWTYARTFLIAKYDDLNYYLDTLGVNGKVLDVGSIPFKPVVYQVDIGEPGISQLKVGGEFILFPGSLVVGPNAAVLFYDGSIGPQPPEPPSPVDPLPDVTPSPVDPTPPIPDLPDVNPSYPGADSKPGAIDPSVTDSANPYTNSATPDSPDPGPMGAGDAKPVPAERRLYGDRIFVRSYGMTIAQVRQLANSLWKDDVIQKIKDLVEAPENLIVNALMMPFDLSSHISSQVENIDLTWILPDVAYEANGKPIDYNMFRMLYGEIEVPRYYNTYLDFSPFSSCHFFIPFVGDVILDTKEVVGHTIKLYYGVDMVTGVSTATVYSSGIGVIGSYPTNLAVQIPISSRNFRDIMIEGVQAVGSMLSQLATTAVGAGVPSLPNMQLSTGQPYNFKQIPQTAGVQSLGVGQSLVPYQGAIQPYQSSSMQVSGGAPINFAPTPDMKRGDAPVVPYFYIDPHDLRATAAGMQSFAGTETPVVRSTGLLSGNHGWTSMLEPYLYLTYPTPNTSNMHSALLGNPSNIAGTLSSFHHLTVFDTVELFDETGVMTIPELKELEGLLKGGVVI